MSILSTLFNFMFPLIRTSFFDSDTEPLGVRIDSNQMMAINPATAMPMVGGVGGIDLRGNLWGQSDSVDGEGSFSSIDYATGILDVGSMFDTGSMFDGCSMFD